MLGVLALHSWLCRTGLVGVCLLTKLVWGGARGTLQNRSTVWNTAMEAIVFFFCAYFVHVSAAGGHNMGEHSFPSDKLSSQVENANSNGTLHLSQHEVAVVWLTFDTAPRCRKIRVVVLCTCHPRYKVWMGATCRRPIRHPAARNQHFALLSNKTMNCSRLSYEPRPS